MRNDAYIVYSEWGPQLRIPREKRLGRKFPQVDSATRQRWIDDFKTVEKTVWRLAEEGGGKAFTREAFTKKILEAHPWMDQKSTNRVRFLASYFAWHEGYDT